MNTASVISAPCLPSNIASAMAGASSVRCRTRLMNKEFIFSAGANSANVFSALYRADSAALQIFVHFDKLLEEMRS